MDLKPRLPRLPRRWWSRGFTQMELVTTIAVASLMSASMVPKMIPQASRSAANWQAVRLADDLRHARLLAMSLGKPLSFNSDAASWRVSCVNAGTCTVVTPSAQTCPNPTSTLLDPGHHGGFCVAVEGGITLSGPASIQFDLLGRPQSAGTMTYQLSANGTVVATVSVASGTGFVTTAQLQ